MAVVKDHAGEMVGAVEYRDFVNKNNPVIVQVGAHDGILIVTGKQIGRAHV